MECDNSQKLTQSLHYYIKEGKVNNPRRGIYTKASYNEQEMACSLFRPAYISLEYVLKTGILRKNSRSGLISSDKSSLLPKSYL